jgi:two-component system sensor histidine kinase QseC
MTQEQGRGALARQVGSLRFRLAVGMVLVLALAVAASVALDTLRLHLSPGLARLLDIEPVQDGLVLGGFAVAVLGLIWGVCAWSLRPLAQASAEAARAGPAQPGARISTARLPTELQPLVGAFNGALARLEAAYDAQRRFTADAAHELRTPLSILSLRLEQARDAGQADWPAIEGDVRQMARLVNQLLDLARKEQAGRGAPAPVNLARVAREAAAMMLPMVEAAGRRLRVELPEAMMLSGRAGDLTDALVNLLENAAVHGAGTILVTGAVRVGEICLDVADEGQGVAPPLREAMFARFAKRDGASGGTGLGLAIVREVVQSHGGQVGFVDGAGCVVRVVLPTSF